MKTPIFFTLPAVLLLSLLQPGRCAEEVVHGTDRFDFVYRAKLPEIHGRAQLWMPVAKTGPFQSVKIERMTAPAPVRKLNDRAGINEILLLSLSAADSGKTIEVEYTVERREKDIYASEADPAPFLRADRLVPRNEVFRAIAGHATDGTTGAVERGRALYEHVLHRMKYDKTGNGWGRGDAVYACDAGAGNCTDFHAYFIALARAIGIPARFAIGATIPADATDGTISGYHCWAEFFADGRWVPVDISEASKHPELAGYYFGHHPANRFELSEGRDLEVEPAPVSGPINFLVYPLLEIDGAPAKVETEFAFHRLPP